MTEEEVEVVAGELAKAGGVAWYPGRTDGPLLRLVSERYRSRARAAIAALDRLRTGKGEADVPQDDAQPAEAAPAADESDRFREGAVVVYRPPGEKRAIPCLIEQLDGNRAYLVPCPQPDFGWVTLDDLSKSDQAA